MELGRLDGRYGPPGHRPLARECNATPEKVLAQALRGRERAQAEGREEVNRLQQEARRLARQVRAQEDRLRVQRLLPDAQTLDKILRYESHASRQLLQALHTLERLQAARAGQPVLPPAVLDVTVEGPDSPPPAVKAAEA